MRPGQVGQSRSSDRNPQTNTGRDVSRKRCSDHDANESSNRHKRRRLGYYEGNNDRRRRHSHESHPYTASRRNTFAEHTNRSTRYSYGDSARTRKRSHSRDDVTSNTDYRRRDRSICTAESLPRSVKTRSLGTFGYKRLERMTNDDNKSVLYELAGAEDNLEKTLNQQEIRRDLMTLLLRVLAKACNAGYAPQNTIIMLSVVKTSTFFKEHLLQHISKMKNDSSGSKTDILEDNFRNCLILFKSLLTYLPSSTRNQVAVLLDLITNTVNTVIKQGEDFDPKIIDEVEEVQQQQVKCVWNAPEGESQREKRLGYSSVEKPPNDFHEFPVFPTLDELSVKERPYLRQNLVRGKYRDLQHYLDVQFRLLREDFVAPLREGIAQFQAGSTRNKKVTDIRVYDRVRILYPVCTNACIVYRIQFDCSALKGVSWFMSKRLIYGSLVCLSVDNFQTVIFGTVANRDPKYLVKGLLDINFRDEVKHLLSSSLEFTMVESVAFFEAYRHVLQGLKEITEHSLPFKEHILKVSVHVDHPQYLIEQPNMVFDLRALLNQHCSAKEAYNEVTLIDRNTWPSPGDTQLDESQLQAVYTALTSNFSVIQGPPGTGKTHVGLKIMQVLLANRMNWGINNDSEDELFLAGPILVVCYTNHALDQFLEGVLDFNEEVVRVGGRSKCERLIPYNLKQIRNKIRKNYAVEDRSLKRCQTKHNLKCKDIQHFIERKTEMFDKTFEGVVMTAHLKPFMSHAHLNSLFYCGDRNSEKSILFWLDLVHEFIQYRGNEITVGISSIDNTEEEASWNTKDFLADDRDVDDDDKPVLNTTTSDINAKCNVIAFDIQSFINKYAGTNDAKVKHTTANIATRVKEQVAKSTRMEYREANQIRDVWALSFEDRWDLYRYWVGCFRQKLIEETLEMINEYNDITKALKEVTDQEDYEILKDSNVIGMTTTLAAKSRALLQRIKPKVIIIEEAAEILESHIVTTLSKHCVQLVLIGDHQQLRPNPTVYRLSKEYNFDTSLFERMIKNGIPCQRLTLQHRMRPDISINMKEHFYPKLQDHDSVMKMPHVHGVCSNHYFIDHSHQELKDDNTCSRSNIHEVSFLVAFCNYLLQQGYNPSQITILTTYTGQLFIFKKQMNNAIFKGVRVCIVDNFQGEENDIILLSLVRSNDVGNIGFLKIENRVCVALSRAKQGLFCIGNFQQLSKQSNIWKKITNSMIARKLIGPSLRLACARHPNIKTDVSNERDFKRVPEGGCRQPCEFRLDCGHVCPMSCHPLDPDHLQYKCVKRCTKKICELNHPCPSVCHQVCNRTCMVKIDKVLPRCGHTQKIYCYSNPVFADCRSRCKKSLECGHRCTNPCGKPCDSASTPCLEQVKKDLPCGHSATVPCSNPLDACPVPCTALLRCEHPCTGTCGGCLQGKLHKACTRKCGRTLICGHMCTEPCIKTCPPCKRPCENRCIHSKCHKPCGVPCIPCREPCEWKCKHAKCTKACGEPCDRDVCNKPCPYNKVPGCSRKVRHPCIGLCGEPCPKKCRICDREEVISILFGSEEDSDARFIQLEDCNHLIEVGGLDHWMNMAAKSENEESVSIQIKGCPKCKTPIRRNLRYCNIIKKILADVEKVKMQVAGDLREILDNKKEALNELECLEKVLATKLRKRFFNLMGLNEFVSFRNEMSLYSFACRLKGKIGDAENCTDLRRQLHLVLQRLFNQKNPMRGGVQEIDEFKFELDRLDLCWQAYNVKISVSELDVDKQQQVQDYVDKLAFLTDGSPLLSDKRDKAKGILQECRELCGGLGITETERKMIIKAVDLSEGHWFKCPNGHIYAIGECGGAMVEGKCPDCQATIGGDRHKLRDDNSLAGEMDGARHAAWSDQANMGNYFLDID